MIPELRFLFSEIHPEEIRDLSIFMDGVARILRNSGKLYSQLGQEALVAGFTQQVLDPFYLEIGAYHPYEYSNTAALRDSLNWRGLSLDPNPQSLEAFKAAGFESLFINKGVGTRAETAYLRLDGAFSDTHHEFGQDLLKVELIDIKVLVSDLSKVTYLSLDIEGGELEILRSFPWEFSKPEVVTVEHNHIVDIENQIRGLMEDLGYRQVLRSITLFESWFVLQNSSVD